MKKEYALYLLEKTKEDYNLIADDFSRTRNKTWEELNFLIENVRVNENVLDLGCGNGRLYELFKFKIVGYYGIDNSEELIEIAKIRYPRANFQVGDALNLPFPDNFFDNVFSVAVFHHIPSKEFRITFLKEAKRVLKPGGKLILTVWHFPAWKKILLFKKNLFFKIIGISKVDFNDNFIKWGKETKRYVHYFSKVELKKLVKKTGLKIRKIKVLKRPRGKESNILLIAEK
jgi:ubiquinone/menaquinone biosynthesis C-methylase UbiE